MTNSFGPKSGKPGVSISPGSSLRPDGSLRPAGFAEMDTGKVYPRPISTPAEETGEQQAQLLLLSGTNAGQVFAIDEKASETVLGRGQNAQICIEDVEASRAHCKITAIGSGADRRYVIEDLRSKNGTYVNAEPIDGPVELAPGDRVHLGPNLVLRFSIVDRAEDSLARQLYETSTRDALTGAYNRRYFIERLTSELAFAQRHTTRLAIIMFDLDHFKEKNDTHGHMAGDAVLRSVAACVTNLIRAEDVFARFGGEEFILLVRGIAHTNVHLLAERIRKAVERLHIAFGEIEMQVTVSVGVASLDEFPVGAAAEALVALADERLYRAKALGRNRVTSTST